ncbi:hypothetical protein PybrP1_008516 [[Pythium] brassicae (nom. inval.)]|nr:hypothetical protein PybrP1_008516 [[Pythium] brassicae (nom. inval.)]
MDVFTTGSARKRAAVDEFDDEEQETEDDGSRDGRSNHHSGRAAATATAAAKRARRHNWQQKYESEFGLVVIEKDHVTGDVVLAMCGFCKAFGREGGFEPPPPPPSAEEEAAEGAKKRRRRSLTTTKFFRAFRVDNIRSHLQGAHPRRWAEFELLPKQEALRARFLQPQGDAPYDALHMVDDVVLGETDLAYAPAPGALSAAVAAHQPAPPPSASSAAAVELPHMTLSSDSSAASGSSSLAAAGLNGSHATASHQLTAMVRGETRVGVWGDELLAIYLLTLSSSPNHEQQQPLLAASARSAFDYEKHAAEQLALDRERLAFKKAKFKKEVELRERELAQRERQMEQDRALHEKLRHAALEAAQQENSKFFRLAEVLRDAVASAASSASAAVQGSSVV